MPSFTKLEKNTIKDIFKAGSKSKKSILASYLDTVNLENKLLSTKKIINIDKGEKDASYLPKSKNKQLCLAGY